MGLFIALVLAGCLFPGDRIGRAFEALPAPEWKPGYAWTFAVTESSGEFTLSGANVNGDSNSRSGNVTMTVFNTTSDVGGRPAYFVRMDATRDDPRFPGSIL